MFYKFDTQSGVKLRQATESVYVQAFICAVVLSKYSLQCFCEPYIRLCEVSAYFFVSSYIPLVSTSGRALGNKQIREQLHDNSRFLQ
jgi:hypothetical protein